jgi:hypothetical protein
MKSLRLLLLYLAFFAVYSAPLVAAGGKGLDILIAADAIHSPEGLRPKPGQPIHYLLSLSRDTLGGTIAGVKLPGPAVVEKAVVAELANQGFIRTDVGGPLPEIVILAVVGAANFEQPTLSYGANPLFEADFAEYLYMVDVRRVLERNFLGQRVPTTLHFQLHCCHSKSVFHISTRVNRIHNTRYLQTNICL